MGLERVQLADDGSQVSVWDGREFVFNESSWSLVTLYRMYRRYAPATSHCHELAEQGHVAPLSAACRSDYLRLSGAKRSLVCRYGLSYFYMRGAPAAMLQRYKRLYTLQVR